MILVTGANGFIGSHVVKLLARDEKRIRCFLREGADLTNLEDEALKGKLEYAYGDVRDPDSLRRALRGVGVVYHTAAYAYLWCPDPKLVYDINWRGSRNVFQACLEEGVDRVVYTNTAAILRGGTKERPSNEEAALRLNEMPGHYTRSKLLGYEEALKYVKMGLPVVIVSPTTPVGDGDYRLTPPGKMIVDFLRGKTPGFIDTVINYIDVEDAAAGHLLAAAKGVIGERYLLGAHNLTLEEVFGILSRLSGRPAPRVKFPAAPLLPLGFICDGLSRWVTHREPPIPWEGLMLARRPLAFDCCKAVRQLGLPQGGIEGAFRRAIEWFYAKGYIR